MPTSNVNRLAQQGQGSCLSTHLCIWFMIIVSYVNTGRAQDTNSTQYAGCFKTTFVSDIGPRSFMNHKPSSQPGTIDGCITACGQDNYTYAGGENRNECWCGNVLNNITSNGCIEPCINNNSQICGAGGVISVYLVCPPGSFEWTQQGCQVQCERCINNKCLVTTGACVSRQCEAGWNGTRCDQDINECLLPSKVCDQNCINTPGSYYCTCNAGYSLQNSNQSCADIDECSSLSLNRCNQNCTNTNGSYLCSCFNGFSLQDDNQTCTSSSNVCSGNLSCFTTESATIPLNVFVACVVTLSILLIASICVSVYQCVRSTRQRKDSILSSIPGPDRVYMNDSVVSRGNPNQPDPLKTNSKNVPKQYETLVRDADLINSEAAYERIQI